MKKAENFVKSRLSAFFVASLPGFEPGAFRLGGGPSILLRYGRMMAEKPLFSRLSGLHGFLRQENGDRVPGPLDLKNQIIFGETNYHFCEILYFAVAIIFQIAGESGDVVVWFFASCFSASTLET